MKWKPCAVMAVCIAGLVIGCKNPEIIHVSGDTYIHFKESHVMGWGNLGNLKSDVLKEANAFAEGKGKMVEIISSKENPPGFGKYASYEIQFRLIDKIHAGHGLTDFVPADGTLINTRSIAANGKELDDLTATVLENALKVSPGKKYRLAVMPIVQTESQGYSDKGFSSFLTEKVTSALGSAGPSLRLYERSRLDAVLKEQALVNNGLFSDADAKKLGELAPIDFILTGTFTRLGNSVTVNGRFIDVVTGEVVVSFSRGIPIVPEIEPLFGEVSTK